MKEMISKDRSNYKIRKVIAKTEARTKALMDKVNEYRSIIHELQVKLHEAEKRLEECQKK